MLSTNFNWKQRKGKQISFLIAKEYIIHEVRSHSYIESSHSSRRIDASGWVNLALWRWDLTHEISIFVKIRFNFKKNIRLNKGKPYESPFNIAKNQEFELITSRHFKNLISPTPAWNRQWSLIPSRNFKQ